MIVRTEIILYVASQKAATEFYAAVLGFPPTLNVPGMTEFELPGGVVLGLMPEAGVRRLLGATISDPASANGVSRAELYLVTNDPARFHAQALAAGARELSGLSKRDWGHWVAYSVDPDGHVLAFAAKESDYEQWS